MWRLVAITKENGCDEIAQIPALIEKVFTFIHIRKPGFSDKQMRDFIENIDNKYYKYLSLHDCLYLAKEYGLGGVHINKRNNDFDASGFRGRKSCSCHSLGEVNREKNKYDYVFLSPIYDSISKEGYKSGFSKEELRLAKKQEIIDQKVFALGGINYSNIDEIKSLGFGGAAMLGAIWK